MRDEAAKAEQQRLHALQRQADRVEALLREGTLTPAEQDRLIAEVRDVCRRLFPDKLYAFDLIYQPRFERARREPQATSPGPPPRPPDAPGSEPP